MSVKHLPMLLVTGLLTTGLLLSGCSDNKSDDADTTKTIEVPEQTAATDTEDTTADILENEGVQITDSVEDKSVTNITSDDINPLTAAPEQPSLVTNPTEAGTPEDTVKQALNTLYYGDVKKAATYYKVDMANFTDELAKTQSAFKQTVEGVTITNTKYNEDKTEATIDGELMLKGQKEPAPLGYELQKIEGKWKILG